MYFDAESRLWQFYPLFNFCLLQTLRVLATADANSAESVEMLKRARKFVIAWGITTDKSYDAKEFMKIAPVVKFAYSTIERP